EVGGGEGAGRPGAEEGRDAHGGTAQEGDSGVGGGCGGEINGDIADDVDEKTTASVSLRQRVNEIQRVIDHSRDATPRMIRTNIFQSLPHPLRYVTQPTHLGEEG